MAIQSGADVKTGASMFGHHSASYSMDKFTDIIANMKRNASEKISVLKEAFSSSVSKQPPDILKEEETQK